MGSTFGSNSGKYETETRKEWMDVWKKLPFGRWSFYSSFTCCCCRRPWWQQLWISLSSSQFCFLLVVETGRWRGGKRDKGKKGLIYHVYPSEHNTRTSPWPPLLPSVCNSVKKTEGFSHSFYKWGGKITVFFVFYPSRKNECPLFRAATLPGGWSWLRLKKITIPSNSCC